MTNSPLKVIYMGTPGFAVAPLEAVLHAGHQVVAVVTVPDKPAGRGQKVHTSAVKDFALSKSLNILQPEKLRDPEFVSTLRSLDADVMIVVAFRMLPDVVWKLPRLGTFNLHASLLPKYRGAAPINWAVINGEEESGVTTFLIDDKIDTGSILLQEKVSVEENETAGTLHDKLMVIGADLVVKTLAGLSNGTISPKPQQESSTIKNAPKIFRDDCRINWDRPGVEIEALIRGMSPYPAAFTTITSDEVNGDVKITAAKFSSEESKVSKPYLKIDGKALFVQLEDGKLFVEKLQPQGKRAMLATDFINGIRNKEQFFELK